jgi:hypothetical protein
MSMRTNNVTWWSRYPICWHADQVHLALTIQKPIPKEGCRSEGKYVRVLSQSLNAVAAMAYAQKDVLLWHTTEFRTFQYV